MLPFRHQIIMIHWLFFAVLAKYCRKRDQFRQDSESKGEKARTNKSQGVTFPLKLIIVDDLKLEAIILKKNRQSKCPSEAGGCGNLLTRRRWRGTVHHCHCLQLPGSGENKQQSFFRSITVLHSLQTAQPLMASTLGRCSHHLFSLVVLLEHRSQEIKEVRFKNKAHKDFACG